VRPVPALLALNNLTNSLDPRHAAFHEGGSELFVLRIRATRMSDSGLYECQVAPGAEAGDKARSWYIRLAVVGERAAP